MTKIPIEVLENNFAYCHETGLLTHKHSRGGVKAGVEAGYLNKDGYRVVKVPVDGKRVQIMVHIVGFVLHHRKWPLGDVDHHDTIRNHNWITNLRDANRSQNLANRNKKGPLPKGVTHDRRHKTKPFMAQLKANGKNHYLGHFDCPLKAAEAYRGLALQIYGEFART